MWEHARLWWIRYTREEDTPFDSDALAWLISLVLNVIMLAALRTIGLQARPENSTMLFISTLPDEAEVDFDPVLQIETVGEQPNEARPQSDAEAIVLPVEHLSDALPHGDIQLEWVPPVRPPASLASHALQDLIAPVSVTSTSIESSTTASGVFDRLTLEIVASLEQRSTAVCWVFDQSLSLARQRTEIAGRMERIAMEIDATPGAKTNDLLNLVYGYGQRATRVTAQPTADIGTVANAIRQIPVDDSGIEMTFSAVERAAQDAVALRRRLHPKTVDIIVIVFTDEAGDDQEIADRVADFCSRAAVRVFVVGVPAPFGQRAVKFKFKEFDPHYADVEAWAQVDQGPESRHPEVVRILMGGPLDAPIDSGFGPFSLCKLCRICSGTYFAVHPDRNRRGEVKPGDSAAMASHLRYFFDPEVMRAYRPLHDSDHVIRKELAANAAKHALVKAADHTADRPLAGLSRQVMRFLATDQARLIKDLSEAQKESASLEPRIDELLRILEAGRSDRRKLTDVDRRWQAGYDLALGRTLALKARTVGYNMMLADAKSKKFLDIRNNTWILDRGEPADEKPLDSRLKKVIDETQTLLDRVVREHQGTPWALIAAEELRTPLGYSWREAYTPPPPPPKPAAPPGSSSPPRPPKDDERQALPKPQPRVLPTKI